MKDLEGCAAAFCRMRNIFLKGFPKGFWEDDIGRLAVAVGATVTSSMVWKDKKGKMAQQSR